MKKNISFITSRIIITLVLISMLSTFFFAIDLYINAFIRELDLSLEYQMKRSGLFLMIIIIAVIFKDLVDYVSKKIDK